MKSRFKILVIFFASLSISALAANLSEGEGKLDAPNSVVNVSINGIVIDKETGEALTGVAVRINNVVTYSDFEGHFTAVINEKEIKVKAEMISYNPQELTLDLREIPDSITIELNPVKD